MDDMKNNLPEENSAEETEVNTEHNDDFVIGKGFVVEEDYQSPEEPVAPKRRKNKRGNNAFKTIIWILSIVVVALGIAFSVIYVGADYLGIGFGRGENCVVEIESGSSTPQIAEKLKEANAVRCPFVFRVYSKLKGYDSKYKYGVYTFNNEAGYEDLAEMLMTEGAKAESVSVTIPEMSTIDEMAEILENKGVCTKSDFINVVQNTEFDFDFLSEIPDEKVYYRLEGYLFPDTYDFYCYESKECAYLAVEKMLKTLDQKLTADMHELIKNSDYSFHELMTMASIVELEAGGSVSEMENVAAVFFNRLKSDEFQKLESSPTKKYPHGDGRYDTYKCIGLPPGPLCAPSLNSIKATLSPTPDFDYYYFVTDAKMDFYFNKTLSDHNKTIARLKKENNWIGDK